MTPTEFPPFASTKKVTTDDEYKAHETQEKVTHLANGSHCLWYEFTPYEIGCDELGGGCLNGVLSVIRGNMNVVYSMDSLVVSGATIRKWQKHRALCAWRDPDLLRCELKPFHTDCVPGPYEIPCDK